MMSETHIKMEFQLLPNEILIECFAYLNAFHIFHSFDQLNYRFNQLIRNIPLYVDFQNIHRSVCDQFCIQMLSNQELKKRIYSLHLSNEDTCYPIKWFLSRFSLTAFVHLRSLTLTAVTQNNLEKLKKILPLMTELSSFRMIGCIYEINETLYALPMSQIRTLLVPRLSSDFILQNNLSSIDNLTISRCSWDELCQVLDNVSKLNYLTVNHIYQRDWNKDVHFTNHPATYLNRLIISAFNARFRYFKLILKRTPNLKNLTIDASFSKDSIDAREWENLITSSLPYLNIFKFKFKYSAENINDSIHEKFKQFQSDFLCKQHHWYTEYSLSTKEASIYTIPYTFNNYELFSDTNRYSNHTMNNSNIFDNVRCLTAIADGITEKCQYHFPHLNKLILGDTTKFDSGYFLLMKHIENLKMIVNLATIKDLTINRCKLETKFVVTNILKEAKQVLSLAIDATVLKSLMYDEDSRKYLNRMIKKLDICGIDILGNSKDINQFRKVFSNHEQLKTVIYQRESLLFLLQHLSKLTYIKFYPTNFTYQAEISWLEEETHKLGIKIITDFDDHMFSEFSIWIIRNIH
jgi:hypothetical protein